MGENGAPILLCGSKCFGPRREVLGNGNGPGAIDPRGGRARSAIARHFWFFLLKMRSRDLPGVLITGLVLLAFAGCESAPSNAPPVTAALIRTGTRENADARMLSRGRSLLLHRC